MNKVQKAQELAWKVGISGKNMRGDIETNWDQLMDFAELIVRECANYAFSDDQDNTAMLKHFGVE
jgi:hypothetical protein